MENVRKQALWPPKHSKTVPARFALAVIWCHFRHIESNKSKELSKLWHS